MGAGFESESAPTKGFAQKPQLIIFIAILWVIPLC